MNIINTITKALLLVVFVAPLPAFAALDVAFENTPLFDVTNFVPGDVAEGDVTVSNTGTDSESVYTQAINVADPDGLGNQMRLRILEGSTVLYDDVFGVFLSSGTVALSTVSSSASNTYTFEVTFIDSADDDYQEKALGFDLCIGFEGGQFSCGESEGGGDGGGGSGGGGSGGGGSGGGGSGGGGGGGGPTGQTPLSIFNEQVLSITVGPVDATEGTATIFWNTNRPATSRIVYGPVSSGPYDLNLSDPNFGYPFTTGEELALIVDHTMTLTDLTPGEEYVFRVISRESSSGLPTVSFEYPFVLAFGVGGDPEGGEPESGGSTGGSGPTSFGGGSGSGSDVSSGGAGTTTGDGLGGPGDGLTAAAFFGLPGELFDIFTSWECMVISLLILLAIYAIWSLVSKLLRWDALSPLVFAQRRVVTFIGLLILAAVFAIILKYFCVVIPLLIVLLIATAWFFMLLLRDGGDDGTPGSEDDELVDSLYRMPPSDS